MGRMVRRTLGFIVILFATAVSVQAVPGPPSGLAATVTGTTVVLNWTAPSGATLIGYRIEAGSAATLSDLASIVVGVAPTFTANAVPAGRYFVRVRAIAADGEGPPSNEIVVNAPNNGATVRTADAASGRLPYFNIRDLVLQIGNEARSLPREQCRADR